ncbi:MAG TPA: aminoacyl-tRNA hydrolase [Candidatus Saccharimonadales bacterium]|nr:aminoacyl-tRNA hydrolase [Candidatus Saccharimonadales bacterium]
MALFQRRPQSSDPKTFYTVGLSKNVLIVGLGNPGEKYELTRHNAGFLCLDDFVARTDEMTGWIDKKNMKCLMSEGRVGAVRVIAIKPATFMNLSGEAVRAVMNFYKINLEQTLVIHDDLDIDFGQIRLRHGGSDAGHNGIKSVSQQIGEDYGRVRIGIGPKRPPAIGSEDFVLQKFSADEQAQLPNMTRETSAIINEYLFGDQQLSHETRNFMV